MAHRVPAELQSLPNLRIQRQLALARDREQREETSRARQVDAQRALQKEMINLQKEPLEGFRINLLDDDNILKWTAVIFGPPDTPYQGGYFKASLDFSRHPFWPPVIRFTPPIHHPNIHRSGMLCYQLVRPPAQVSSGSTWNVRNLLLSFLTLLVDPNPDDPANVEAAIQYRQYKEEGNPTYLHAINVNVAESRELAKRDNVIVPETNEDYTRSGIPTEQQQQSNQTEANVQEEEAQDGIAYPEDEWTNYDDDNEGNLYENLAFPEENVWIRNRPIGGEEDGGLMPAVEDDADTAISEFSFYENLSSSDEEEEANANNHVRRGERTVYQVRSNAEEVNSEDTFYAVSVPDTEDEDDLQPEEGRPTIATQASASISSVYLHDMPRPEPTIANRQLSNDSVYL